MYTCLMVKEKEITSDTSVQEDSPWIEEIKNDNNEEDTETLFYEEPQANDSPEGRSPSPSTLQEESGEWPHLC